MKIKIDKINVQPVKKKAHKRYIATCSARLNHSSSIKCKWNIKNMVKEYYNGTYGITSGEKMISNFLEKNSDSLVKISKILSKVVNISPEKTIPTQRNCQNNLENNTELVKETKLDLFENLKPVNWKLQKLEKKFLLQYLEAALYKYEKFSCTKKWLPSRHKNYLGNGYHHRDESNIISKKNNKFIIAQVKRRPKTSVQTTALKHKYSQTVECNTKDKDLQSWIGRSLVMVESIKQSLKENDIKPLLVFNSNEIDDFQSLIQSLNVDSGRGVPYDDIEPSSKLNEGTNLKDEFLMKVKGTTGKNKNEIITGEIKKVENKKNGKFKDEKRIRTIEPKQTNILPTTITKKDFQKANINMEKIKNSSKLLSKNYSSDIGNTKSHTVKKDSDGIIIPTIDLSSDVYQEESYSKPIPVKKTDVNDHDGRACMTDVAKMIEDYLDNGDENLKQVFRNKQHFYTTLILISEALQRLILKTQTIDDQGLTFSHSIMSVKIEAKLGGGTLVRSISEEIVKECEKVCKFIGLAPPVGRTIEELFRNVRLLIDETTTTFDNQVLKVVEDNSSLREFVLFVQHLVGNSEIKLLKDYFRDILKLSNQEEASSGKVTQVDDFQEIEIKEILDDFELMASVLAIIHLWNESKESVKDASNGPSVQISIVSDYFSLAVSYNSEEVRTDIEMVQQWIFQLLNESPEKQNIDEIYEKFIKTTKCDNIDKLKNVLHNPKILKKLVQKIEVSPEMYIKSNEICRLFRKVTSAESKNKDDQETDLMTEFLSCPESIRKFMSIVDYLNNDDEEEGTTFLLQSDQELIKGNLGQSKENILLKLIKFSNKLSKLENNTRDFERKFPKMFKVLDTKGLSPILKNIFDDTRLLLEVINVVISRMGQDPSVDCRSSNHPKNVDTVKFDDYEQHKTEPFNDTFEISKPKGKNCRFSNSEALNAEFMADTKDDSTSENVTSINNGKSSDPDEKLKSEKSDSIPLEMKDIFVEIPPDGVNETNKNKDNNTCQVIAIQYYTTKSEETRKSFVFDETFKSIPKYQRTSPVGIQRFQSVEETEANIGIMQTENDDGNLTIENTLNINEKFPADESEFDLHQDNKDVLELDYEKTSVERSSTTHSLNAEKLSINSQVNPMILTMDDTLASIDIKGQSINDMATNIGKPLCDLSAIRSPNKILLLDDAEATSKIHSITQPNKVLMTLNDNIVPGNENRHEITCSEEYFWKPSQTTSSDINVSFKNSDFATLEVMKKEPETGSTSRARTTASNIEETETSVKGILRENVINSRDERRELNVSIHSNNWEYKVNDPKILYDERSPAYVIMEESTPVIINRDNEDKGVKGTEKSNEIERKLSLNSQIHNLVSKVDETIASIDVKYQELASVEMTMALQRTSLSATVPPVVYEVALYRNEKTDTPLNFQNQINNLALRLNETISLIEMIREELQQIGTIVPSIEKTTNVTDTQKHSIKCDSVIIKYKDDTVENDHLTRVSSDSDIHYNDKVNTERIKKEPKDEVERDDTVILSGGYNMKVRSLDVDETDRNERFESQPSKISKKVHKSKSPKTSDISMSQDYYDRSQSSQTLKFEVCSGTQRSSFFDEDGNTSDETVRTLGFMVCYLLTLLAAQ